MSVVVSGPVFGDCMEVLEGSAPLNRGHVVELIHQHTSSYSDVTLSRRAGTIQAWMRWVEEVKRWSG